MNNFTFTREYGYPVKDNGSLYSNMSLLHFIKKGIATF